MRRVRKFAVTRTTGVVDELLLKVVAQGFGGELQRMDGWHQSWDAAVSLLRQETSAHIAISEDGGSRNVIAIFSRRNLEAEESQPRENARASVGKRMNWRSLKVGGVAES